MSALGVSEKSARPKGDARARATAQKSGVAKTYAADKLAEKFGAGNEGKQAEIKAQLIKSVAKELKAQEKALGRKLTVQEKRKAAVKAISGEVKTMRHAAKGRAIVPTGGKMAQAQQKRKKAKGGKQTLEDKYASANPSDDDVKAFAKEYRARELKKAHRAGTVETILLRKEGHKAETRQQAAKLKKEAEKEAKTLTDDQIVQKYKGAMGAAMKRTFEYHVNDSKRQAEKLTQEISKTESSARMNPDAKAKKLKRLNKALEQANSDVQLFTQRLADVDKNAERDLRNNLQTNREYFARGLDKADRSDVEAVMRHVEGGKGTGFTVSQSAQAQTRSKAKQQQLIEERSTEILRDHLKAIHEGRAGDETANSMKALGLKKKPNATELKAAYRKAAAKAHPDRGGSPAEFRRVQEAYQSLKQKLES